VVSGAGAAGDEFEDETGVEAVVETGDETGVAADDETGAETGAETGDAPDKATGGESGAAALAVDASSKMPARLNRQRGLGTDGNMRQGTGLTPDLILVRGWQPAGKALQVRTLRAKHQFGVEIC
jgi:hypothetical protein